MAAGGVVGLAAVEAALPTSSCSSARRANALQAHTTDVPEPLLACSAADAGRSAFHGRSYRVTSPVSGATYQVLRRRALTARQASLLLRSGRLHASRNGTRGMTGSGSDAYSMGGSDGLSAAVKLEGLGPSHPISVGTSSGRPSDAGCGSDAGSSVLGGIKPLPPRGSGE